MKYCKFKKNDQNKFNLKTFFKNMSLVYFIHIDNKYPFDLSLFNTHSDFFLNHVIEHVYPLLSEFDSYRYLTNDSISDFIDYCQNREIQLNELNVISINYLSQKYHVNSLYRKTEEFIQKNHKTVTQAFFSNIENRDFAQDIPLVLEEIISNFFDDYLFDFYNILLLIPLSRIYKILFKYSINKKQISIINNSRHTNDEIEHKIIDFLFDYIEKFGIDSSILLKIFDFERNSIEYFNEKLFEYSDFIDFNCIKKNYSKTHA